MPIRSRVLMIAASILIASSLAHASVPVHQWSRHFGAGGSEAGYGITTDSAGNVIVTGNYGPGTDFGGGPLPWVSNLDFFIAKFDANGTHLWSKGFGGCFLERGWAVTTDTADNIIVIGQFCGTIDFGGGPLASNAGSDDVFLLKFAPNGTHIWSKRFGGVNNTDIGYGVDTDASGNILLTGTYFNSGIDFGGGPLTGAGSTDAFVAKLDPNGAHIWSKGFGGTGGDRPNSCAFDAAGNVLVTGVFSNTINFGGGPLVSAGGGDFFIVQLDASGNHQWSKATGGPTTDAGEVVAIDGLNRVVVVGRFNTNADFGGGALPIFGGDDIFVAQFDASGSHLWSQSFGSSSGDLARSVAIDASNNVIVTGSIAGTANLGGGPLTTNGSGDVFIASYTAAGAHRWSQSYGSAGFEDSHSVAVDGAGNVLITGQSSGPVNFGGGTLAYGGAGDCFVAKYFDEEPVPVLITHFAAVPHGPRVEVSWRLQSDERLDGYTLYRATGSAAPRMITEGSSVEVGSYLDMNVKPGETYRYQLEVRTTGGDAFRSQPMTVTMPTAVTSLGQNYPNPFNPRTTIEYVLASRSATQIAIYDAAGARVKMLDLGTQDAGTHIAHWDGRDDTGKPVSSGVYFYRLNGTDATTRKMILLK